jgi:asparagine synthase (glutamine-hydrolysing)
MCGIVASVSSRGRVSPEGLARAAASLAHRGPDAQAVWTASHGRAGLGHARLSIIDLATGDQPLHNEDDSLHLVVNGEFYDFERIRTELQAKGHRFKTGSDSEIALHLYEDLGARAMHQLRGEFAFALWDQRDGVLFAARDRFGIKPLYYALVDGACHVASEVKALKALGVPLRWDREVLFDIHYGLMHAPSRSAFDGIYQVPPGCYLLTDGVHAHVHSYWDFNYPPAEVTRNGDAREAVERLRAVLDEAVKLRLRADVPVACYLSGGLDSCTVLGLASKLAAHPLRAYTLSFDMADYDERAIAEAQAKLSGAEFHPIEIRSEQLADHLEDALYHSERPFVNAHSVAKFLLSKAVRDSGIKVVMTGEGADEVFAGYPFFRRDLVLHNMDGQDPEHAKHLIAELEKANTVSAGLLLPTGDGGGAFDSIQRVLGFVPTILATWGQQGQGMRKLLNPEFTSAFNGRDSFRALFNHLDVEGQLAGREAVNQALYIWAKTSLPNYILSNLGDRMEMAHSVEGRLPFLDHKVVEEVVRMPVSMKIKGMTEKYVLREAAKPVLIDAVYRRQKHPFLSPPATLQTDGSLFALIQDTLRGPLLERTGIYDRKKVLAMLDAIPQMNTMARTSLDVPLTWITSLCLLHERLQIAD